MRKEEKNTYRTRGKRVNVAALCLGHAVSHVRIARQVQILDQNGVGASVGDLEFKNGGFENHVGFFRETLYVIFQYNLLVANLPPHFSFFFFGFPALLFSVCFECEK